MKSLFSYFSVLLAALGLGCAQEPKTELAKFLKQEYNMTPNAKNLKKLAEVPFFDLCTRPQLEWVDNNTDEYGLSSGENVPVDDDMESTYWVLLYGGWKLVDNEGNTIRESAGIGEWFRKADISNKANFGKLEITTQSYLLMVPEDKMEAMVDMDFPIKEKLESGTQPN